MAIKAATTLVPKVIQGIRYLIPKGKSATVDNIFKKFGPQAVKKYADDAAQRVADAGKRSTSTATKKGGTPPKRSVIKVKEEPTVSRSTAAKNVAKTGAKKIARTIGDKLTGAAARRAKRNAARKGVGYTSPKGTKVVRQSTTKPDGTRKLTGNVKGASKKQAAAGDAMAKAAGKKIAKRRLRNAALTAAGVGSLAGMGSLDTSKSDSKKQTSDNKTKTFGEAFAAARKEKGAGKTFMYKGKKYTTDRADDKPKVPKKKNFGSMDGSTSDPNTMTKRPPAKKKRDRLFGLKSMPKIDSKKGGDKVNLPFGLGSYETLPQEEDYSKNKRGGSIKRQSGGRMRKAGCKRGMGKALRGY